MLIFLVLHVLKEDYIKVAEPDIKKMRLGRRAESATEVEKSNCLSPEKEREQEGTDHLKCGGFDTR